MNMYVSNLDYNTSEDDLRKLFEPFGKITSARVITGKDTGRSRGFGFVEMESTTDANTAMNTLNGKDVKGRAIAVTEAREKESRSDRKKW